MGDIPEPAKVFHPPVGHPAVRVGRFGERIVCQACGVICLPNAELGGWIGVDYDPSREDDAYLDEYPHLYEYPTRVAEPAADDLGDAPEPELADLPIAAPARQDAQEPAPWDEDEPVHSGAFRETMGLDTYPRRSDHQPSRTPEARHREYERKRRQTLHGDRARVRR